MPAAPCPTRISPAQGQTCRAGFSDRVQRTALAPFKRGAPQPVGYQGRPPAPVPPAARPSPADTLHRPPPRTEAEAGPGRPDRLHRARPAAPASQVTAL